MGAERQITVTINFDDWAGNSSAVNTTWFDNVLHAISSYAEVRAVEGVAIDYPTWEALSAQQQADWLQITMARDGESDPESSPESHFEDGEAVLFLNVDGAPVAGIYSGAERSGWCYVTFPDLERPVLAPISEIRHPATTKDEDPRYIPGLSLHHHLPDADWFAHMGPIPKKEQP